jgi:hypothetical protein
MSAFEGKADILKAETTRQLYEYAPWSRSLSLVTTRSGVVFPSSGDEPLRRLTYAGIDCGFLDS